MRNLYRALNTKKKSNQGKKHKISEPLVSVIVAVKNGERYLEEAVKSIFAQTYKNYEVIVVDGHSTDNTKKIAQSFEGVRYVLQRGPGISGGYNTGIDETKGEFIAFLSSDDLWTPDKLRTQINHMLQYPDIQFTVAKFKYFLEKGCKIPPGFKESLLGKTHIGRIMETLVVRKSLFNSFQRFNVDFKVAEDVDWYSRANDSQIPMAVIDAVLLHKRIHDTNLSINAQTNTKNLLKIVKQSIDRKRSQKINANQ